MCLCDLYSLGILIIFLQISMRVFHLVVVVVLLWSVNGVYDILSFGAVANSDTLMDQLANSRALFKAIMAANVSEGERVVRIPSKKFYSMPVRVSNVHNISILILGRWMASQNIAKWPRLPEMQKFY